MTEQRFTYRNRDGVRRTMIVDDERPGDVTVLTEQDVEPILEGVARDRETMTHDGVNKLVARLPVEVFERAVHQQWSEADWRRYLNSSEAAPFRIWPGRV